MNNSKLDDVSDTNVGEAIEQKALKLISKYSPWLKQNLLIEEHLYEFDDVAGLIELAIAEEREANKKLCEGVEESKDYHGNKSFTEGVSVGAGACAILIENRSLVPAVQKDEVSE